ncbi:creatininase family protein [Gracilibacillus massiliensis]|uniref:creatininase family protein n=1 Tax=Gracilibacillus massiliensis TaxID=1564956 RepID=UPI00071C30A8|nr:creatininase family protein [Gracilibacillus massiliensis]
MRTRFLSKLTNAEVESYLEQNDLIFIPVGVTETHGALPLDCETVLAEAFALKIAEKTNGLVLHNLPYFFAGATPIGRGTVQMSIKDGMAYLDRLAQSLLNQGFRRQVYITSHGPAYLTVSPMIRDFFDRTKAPILYMDMVKSIEAANLSYDLLEEFNNMLVGGYAILDRLEDVPLQMEENNSVSYDIEKVMKKNQEHPATPLGKFAFQSGAVGYYFDEALDHTYSPLIKSEEHRVQLAEAGVKVINDIVDALNMPDVVQSLQKVDQYTQKVSLPQYGEWLPK